MVINFFILLWNIFSFGFIIPDLIKNSSTLLVTTGIMIALFNIFITIFINYKLIFKKKYENFQIHTLSEVGISINQEYTKKIIEKIESFFKYNNLRKDLETLKKQIFRINEKINKLNEVISKKFQKNEITYAKFMNVIGSSYSIVISNIIKINDKLEAFDYNDYRYCINTLRKENSIDREVLNKKMELYNNYFKFIEEKIKENEFIILKLDNLLLELSNLDSIDNLDMDNIYEIKELEKLIDTTKLYQN